LNVKRQLRFVANLSQVWPAVINSCPFRKKLTDHFIHIYIYIYIYIEREREREREREIKNMAVWEENTEYSV
jgi:hypothetical protein